MTLCKLEVACFNIESARIAYLGKADRVELCRDKSTEGITPFKEDILSLRRELDIPIHVMIRPRAGNYVFDDAEFEQLKKELLMAKNCGIDAIVCGSLNSQNQIHLHQNKELVELAYPLPCNFHRAYDVIENKEEALLQLIDCGYHTVLTSAGYKTALEGAETLAQLIKLAENKIQIMPGGGVRSTHARDLAMRTSARYLHSSAITHSGEIAVLEEVLALKEVLK